MLRSLFPKAHHKFLSLPLLGPIADGFDDWLAASGYTPGSREFAVRMLPHVDADLRRRRVRDVTSLTQPSHFEGLTGPKPFRISKGYPKVFTTKKESTTYFVVS